ncbi:MAG: hypothetical protein LLG42_16235 [Chloroflexi bacterium]|nr:hypothetical protein [Chloroflexota bacterium]
MIANELEIPGSHGMQAQRYPALIEMIKNRIAASRKTCQNTISLDDAAIELMQMNKFPGTGITVVTRFAA